MRVLRFMSRRVTNRVWLDGYEQGRFEATMDLLDEDPTCRCGHGEDSHPAGSCTDCDCRWWGAA